MASPYGLLFEPISAASPISASTSSARTALATPHANEGVAHGQRRMVAISVPTGGKDVYVRFGDSTVTASSTTGDLVHAGTTRGFTVPIGATHVAAVAVSDTTTVVVMNGRGF